MTDTARPLSDPGAGRFSCAQGEAELPIRATRRSASLTLSGAIPARRWDPCRDLRGEAAVTDGRSDMLTEAR